VGHSSGNATLEAARTAAYQDALAQISKSILSKVTVQDRTTSLASSFRIRNAEIMPGCIYTEKTKTGYDCWVQVSYPLREKQAIEERIDLGLKLNGLWAKAQAGFHQGAYREAGTNLVVIIEDFPRALYTGFSVEQSKLLLGDVHREQKDFLEARRWYESIVKTGTSDKLKEEARARISGLPAAPLFWPMRDRFGRNKVAILACVREGGPCERSGDLTSILMQHCREARLESVDIAGRLTPGNLAGAFDTGPPVAVRAAALKEGAAVILAVLLDIDPARRGKQTEVLGVKTMAIDTRVKFRVLSVPADAAVYDGQFKAVAGTSSRASLAQRAANTLIRKYLVPKCPTMK
jgi:hypothetical protein